MIYLSTYLSILKVVRFAKDYGLIEEKRNSHIRRLSFSINQRGKQFRSTDAYRFYVMYYRMSVLRRFESRSENEKLLLQVLFPFSATLAGLSSP